MTIGLPHVGLTKLSIVSGMGELKHFNTSTRKLPCTITNHLWFALAYLLVNSDESIKQQTSRRY